MEAKHRPKTRGNGQGTAYKMPSGKWRAEITTGWEKMPDGKKKRHCLTKSGFKTKREALDYIRELREGASVNPSITFSQLYDKWSKEHFPKVSKDMENGYKAAYSRCEDIKYRQFSTLKTADLQKIVDNAKLANGEPASRRSKADIKSLFNNMYKYAMKNDYSSKNYAEYVELEKKPKSKKDAFKADEIEKIWKEYNSGNDFAGYILIMIYTGMRFGELSTIKIENIHLDDRYMIGGIKTDAGIDRQIPICEKIAPIIEKIILVNKNKLLEMHEKVFYNAYYTVLEKIGVRNLNPHCCRHTFFTLMAERGVQPAVITETGGHEDYSTTLQYTHIPIADKINAVNLL